MDKYEQKKLEAMKSMPKTICIDLDGVISSSSEYLGDGIINKPVKDVVYFLKRLKEDGWTIIIFTCRDSISAIETYLISNGIPYDSINMELPSQRICNKPLADVYVDDRAITFDGNWKSTYNKIKKFKSWCKTERNTVEEKKENKLEKFWSEMEEKYPKEKSNWCYLYIFPILLLILFLRLYQIPFWLVSTFIEFIIKCLKIVIGHNPNKKGLQY